MEHIAAILNEARPLHPSSSIDDNDGDDKDEESKDLRNYPIGNRICINKDSVARSIRIIPPD